MTYIDRCIIQIHQRNLFVEWYTKSAEQGDARGQCNLGVMYENGRGVTKDLKKAVEWYTKAAEQDDEEAIVALARLLSKIKNTAQFIDRHYSLIK